MGDADVLVLLALIAVWGIATGAFGAWLRDEDAKVRPDGRWPWMYLAYVQTGLRAVAFTFLGFTGAFMLIGFYGFMFVLGPGLIIAGIFNSEWTPAGRVAAIIGGILIASVFTVFSLKMVKEKWDEMREENLRDIYRREEEQRRQEGP